eukprot:TRINITY_DN774090_c0_g1_i1.p1 TRINITY_DN774090_c0_g1~~TRINITY_DN774090_c0_g1_i1.p1  ORF type:complete len:638 (+),score=169.06 TRINITY_DN774090_c0_g1_i1:70-1983(+)
MRISGLFLCLVASLFILGSCQLFSEVPNKFKDGETVPMIVNRLSSPRDLPYDYFSLPFCHPEGGLKTAPENIGEFLTGNRNQDSGYKIKFKEDSYCNVMCKDKEWSSHSIKRLIEMIEIGYYADWTVDSMPATYLTKTFHQEHVPLNVMSYKDHFEDGFPIGVSGYSSLEKKHVTRIYNHLRFKVRYHNDNIVFFQVEPHSIDHKFDDTGKLITCSKDLSAASELMGPLDIVGDKDYKITFTYDIIWVPESTKWDNRWDIFFKAKWEDNLAWNISIIGGSVLGSIMLGALVWNTIKKEIIQYNNEALDVEDLHEEVGWKYIHGDVFRPPLGRIRANILAVLVGSGVQVYLTAFLVCSLAALGLGVSYQHQGTILGSFIAIFTLIGSYACGFVASKIHKSFKLKNHLLFGLLMIGIVPGVIMSCVFLMNTMVWIVGSSAAIPFAPFFVVILMWLIVGHVMYLTGMFGAFKQEPIKPPTRINDLPRQIPKQNRVMGYFFAAVFSLLITLCNGTLIGDIFDAIWLDRLFTSYTAVVIVLIMLAIICAEAGILRTYICIRSEDWQWWWKAFATPACSGLWIFSYAIAFHSASLDLASFEASVWYFVHTAWVCFLVSVMCGCFGVISSYFFLRHIYSSIKCD